MNHELGPTKSASKVDCVMLSGKVGLPNPAPNRLLGVITSSTGVTAKSLTVIACFSMFGTIPLKRARGIISLVRYHRSMLL